MGMTAALSKKAHQTAASQHWLHRLHPSSVVPISFPDEDFESGQTNSHGFRRARPQPPHGNHHNMSVAFSPNKEGSKGLLNFNSVVGSMPGGSRTSGYKTVDHLHLTNINIE